MAYTGQVFVFISRASIDVYTDAREMTRQGLGSDSDAIREGREL